MKIVDVNIMVGGVNRDDPYHSTIHQWWIENLGSQEAIRIPWVVAVGFLRISTLPRVFQTPLTPDLALQRLRVWLSHANVEMITEMPNHFSVLESCIREAGASGNLANDAHLAALAISRGATLVSCDTDFARFRHLRWENPLVA
jgi:toxin-antitoxin system PIN domain toxin